MSELIDEYRTWILSQELDGCTLAEGPSGNLSIESELVKGWINFYDIDDMEIVELRLERVLDGEPAFFLHFEMEDLDRAKQLFTEMADALYEMNHREVRHVLLCCTVGMTTTYFAMKLNEVAQSMGVDYDFTAQPIEEAKRNGSQYAAVLLAPQVGHQRKQVAELLPNTPVIEIPGKIFGSYDANAALRLVMDVLSGSRIASDDQPMQVKRSYDKTKRILVVSYVHRKDEPTLSYRVYDHGEVAASGMLVRRSFDIRTLEDLAATLRVQGWKTSEFDGIGVGVPGIVNDGVVIQLVDGEELHYDLKTKLEEMWGTKVFVDYNATAAAVGCYVTQDKYESIAFHAQAVGLPDGEEGYVIEGKPLIGRNGRSGHLGPLASGFALSMDLEDSAWRVTGMRELVGRYLASLACTIAPEAIYVWCDLLPDMDELREELAKTLPESAIPDLVEVIDYDECLLVGVEALCLKRLEKHAEGSRR